MSFHLPGVVDVMIVAKSESSKSDLYSGSLLRAIPFYLLVSASFLLLFLTFCFHPAAFAGNTGKLAGSVIDSKTKEPLVGVNLVLEGTTFGAASDPDGKYSILNLPPGIYSLKASLIGYNSLTIHNLKISIDLTTRRDLELGESAIEVGEVVITAERPLVQKDITATTSVIDEELISTIAVTEVQDLIKLQAGVAVSPGGQIHIRGGRSGQVAYQIDGVPVTDAYDGSNTIDVGANVIQELQVISGAFNAEYGHAMSGVVNIVTKDGGGNLSGNFQTYTGSYASNRDDIFWNIGDVSTPPLRSVEGSLTGPIIPNKLSFVVNGRYFYNRGHLYGRRVFLPTDLSLEDPSSGGTNFFISQGGDSSFVPMNANERMFTQGKLSYRISSGMKLSYNYIFDGQEYQDYDHGMRLTPDNNLTRFRKTHSNILSLNHAVSNSSFYNLSYSYLFKDYRHYLYEEIYTGDSSRPTMYVDNRRRQNPPYSYEIGGTNGNRFTRNTGTYALKLDWTNQLSENVSLQAGGEFKKHHLYYESITLVPLLNAAGQEVFPYNVGIAPPTSQDFDQYTRFPKEAAAYLQSKFEAFNIIFNAGIRFDLFDPSGTVLADPSDPEIHNPTRPNNQFTDTNGNGVFDSTQGERRRTIAERATYWYKKASKKSQISPRVGLAFPISADGVIHFSYGHFFQLPGYELLYSNPGFKLGVGSGNRGLFGNADLEPQKTIKGEIGIKQQITQDIAADVTMFFEDFRNLTGTQTEDIDVFGEGVYSRYSNSDFGFAKGIVVKFEKRFGDGMAATLDYTYSITKGNASNPADARNSRLGGGSPETFIASLDWDQTHTLNTILSYSRPRGFGCSIIGNFSSGQPYTPAVNKNSSVKRNSFPRNSAYKPNLFNVDLRANKDFAFGGSTLSLFVRVFNLLDLNNARSVYSNSGDPLFSFDQLDAESINPKLYYNTLDQLYTNPGFFSEPRRIELGTSFTF